MIREPRRARRRGRAARGASTPRVLLPNSFGAALAAWRRAAFPSAGATRPTAARPAPDARAARARARSGAGARCTTIGRCSRALGSDVSAAPDASLALPRRSGRRAAARSSARDGPWIGVNPGASFGTAKRWLPERYAAVADAPGRRDGRPRRARRRRRPSGRWPRRSPRMMREAAASCAARRRSPSWSACSRGCASSSPTTRAPCTWRRRSACRVVAVFGSTDWRETAPVAERATASCASRRRVRAVQAARVPDRPSLHDAASPWSACRRARRARELAAA